MNRRKTLGEDRHQDVYYEVRQSILNRKRRKESTSAPTGSPQVPAPNRGQPSSESSAIDGNGPPQGHFQHLNTETVTSPPPGHARKTENRLFNPNATGDRRSVHPPTQHPSGRRQPSNAMPQGPRRMTAAAPPPSIEEYMEERHQ